MITATTAHRRRSWAQRLLRLPWSFRRQIVVLTAAVTAVAMLLLTLVLQVVLARITNNDVDRVLQDRSDSVVSSIKAKSGSGAISVPDATLDPGVAVFVGGDLVAGSTPRSLQDYYEDVASADRVRVSEANGGQSKVRAQPFTTSQGDRGVVVVTERLEPYEEAESLALIVSLVTGALATGAAAAIAAWTMRRALRPVAEMAATASDWSEHDLGRRFDAGLPTNEISALAGTLDTLLDKVSSAIRSEQRLTSELAHELRTPLTSIQGTADLMTLRHGDSLSADARADLAEISASSRRMASTITTLLDLARSETSAASVASCFLDDVVAEIVGHLPSDGPRVVVDMEDGGDTRVALPHALAVRAVSPVVDNALHFAHSTISLTSTTTVDGVELMISDDGAGVDAEVATTIFEPGRTSGTSAGAGLGLAISRRIARTAGGDVYVTDSDSPSYGARFIVRFPLA